MDKVIIIRTKQHADLMAELLDRAAANGPNARALADLYEQAQAIKESFEA